MKKPVIFWYRQDLRTYDLPALAAAIETGRPIIPCYIHDDAAPGPWAPGAASRWWLHHSLLSLTDELEQSGGRLILRQGDTLPALRDLALECGADLVLCTRRYEPWAAQQEQELFTGLGEHDILLKRYGGSLLFEPGRILNQSGQPFKVFTPFWRNCRSQAEPPTPLETSEGSVWADSSVDSEALAHWDLCPTSPDWAAEWLSLWTPGTAGARGNLSAFLAGPVEHYDEARNHPARQATTRLSPHLHFGEISPREVWHAARQLATGAPDHSEQVDKFLSELGWREFSHHLLYHFPHIPEEPFKPKFRHFPWLGSDDNFRAWTRGHTGYPMVDAGMRELWRTGFMHNRVRMITASFLTKHLLIPWQAGARWFWDTLLDADLANNSSGWQWVAGSGADASPYFRIFNPVTQGQKFDGDGSYVRRWVPELAGLPDRFLHRPWEAPPEILEQAGVSLGSTYPEPMVQHQAARESALAAYNSL